MNARARPGAIVMLIVGIPTLAVLLSTIGLVLAAGGAGDLVRDDYYKAGMVVQQDLSAERRAQALGLGVVIDVRGARIELRSAQALPSALQVALVHPAWAQHDSEATLILDDHLRTTAASGSDPAGSDPAGSEPEGRRRRWYGTLDAPLPAARWAVFVTAEGARWRLRGTARLPGRAALGTAPGAPAAMAATGPGA